MGNTASPLPQRYDEAGLSVMDNVWVTDPDDCGGHSQAFIEGCRVWADEATAVAEGVDKDPY
jgi:hypothetical protein